MAKPYGDDLRRKFLLAYDQGEETLEELAVANDSRKPERYSMDNTDVTNVVST